jgi:chemotaxis protein MotA
MFAIIGIVFSLFCTFLGFYLHGGSFGVFVEAWTEFVVIIGAGIGIFVGSNGIGGVKLAISAFIHMLKPTPYTKPAYLDLLVMLYKFFTLSRTEGVLALESHIEDPHKSPILSSNPAFLHNHHAIDFFCDTMKVVVTGGVQPHDLADMMEKDLDAAHAEENLSPDALQGIGDALPAVGIVACVLGVIITMGHIGGEASEIGKAIGSALVGTLLGVMVAYLVVTPIVKAMQAQVRAAGQYMNCIRNAIECGVRGDPPMTAVEMARRNIEPGVRPSFSEMTVAIKERGKK